MATVIINGTPISTASTPGTSTAIVRPTRVRRKTVLTLAGVVDHLLRVEDINPGQTRAVERACFAAQAAKDSFITYSAQGFKYYDAIAQVTFQGDISLGEVVASSNVITPTSAPTWPDWMQFATIRIDDKNHQVESYLAGTSATVTNIPDGTYSAATLQNSITRLPKDFRRRGSLTDGSRTYPVTDVSTGILRSLENYYEWVNSTANPLNFAAVAGDSRFQAELFLAVWPTYTAEKVLSLSYERYMAELEIHRLGTGLATTVGTAVTSVDDTFTDDHIGCAITFSTDATTEINSPLASRDLVAAQRIITDVASATGCTIDSAITGDITGKAFFVSDVVDVMPGAMEQAFLRLAEYEFARASKSKTADKRFAEFMAQMDIAKVDDSRYRDSVDDVPFDGAGYGVGSVTGRPDL